MSEINIPESLPSWIKEHLELYLEDGEAAHLWDASLAGGEGLLSTLLLTTRGRKTGNDSILPLIYRQTESGGYCVIASKGGSPAHPAWFLNLQSEPLVRLKVANREFEARTRVAEGQEREQLWKLMVDYYPLYNDYQGLTERQIPVVVLDPT